MMKGIFGRPSPALVVAVIALFVALGGTAGAVVVQAVPLAKRALVAENAKKLGGRTQAQIVSRAAAQGAAQAAAQAATTPGPASTAAGTVSITTQSLGTLAPGQERDVSVSCGSGQKVVGGGFASDGAVFNLDSHPQNDTTWRLYLVNGNEGQPAANTNIYAVCIR